MNMIPSGIKEVLDRLPTLVASHLLREEELYRNGHIGKECYVMTFNYILAIEESDLMTFAESELLYDWTTHREEKNNEEGD